MPQLLHALSACKHSGRTLGRMHLAGEVNRVFLAAGITTFHRDNPIPARAKSRCYGLRGASFYRDPSSPIPALLQGLLDLPVWFAEQFAGIGYPFALLEPARWVRLCALPIAVSLAWVLWPALRSSRECRFFALACGLCVAPLIFIWPMSRVLLGSSFGALGRVACTINQGRAAHLRRPRARAQHAPASRLCRRSAVHPQLEHNPGLRLRHLRRSNRSSRRSATRS